jgi:hypothetical protein
VKTGLQAKMKEMERVYGLFHLKNACDEGKGV